MPRKKGYSMNLSGELVAFLSSITWAIGCQTFAKLAGQYESYRINFTRAALSLPFFLVTALILFSSPAAILAAIQNIQFNERLYLLGSILASYAIGDAVFLQSTRYLGAASALAIASCFPIFSGIFGVLFLNEALSGMQWLGLTISVFGIGLILWNAKDAPLKGVFLALLTAVFWMGNTTFVKMGSLNHSAVLIAMIRMAIASVLCPLIALCVGKNILQKNPWIPFRELKKYGWAFLMESFAGTIFFVYGIKNSPVAVGAILVSLAPVLSLPVGIWMGVEKISFKKVLGVLFVVLGLAALIAFGSKDGAVL